MPDEKPPAPDEREPRDLIGWEFWAGKVVLVILSALLAVWLAVRSGSSDATRFQQLRDVSAARNTLRVIKTEIEKNVAAIKSARAEIRDRREPELEVSLDSLRLAAGKSYASLIDAALLADIDRVYAWPLPELQANMAKGGFRNAGREVHDWYIGILDSIVDRSEKVLLPMIAEQDKALAAREQALGGAR